MKHFKQYKLTLLEAKTNSVIDGAIVEYSNELTRNECVKRAKRWMQNIGYGGSKYKVSLKLLTAKEIEQREKDLEIVSNY